MDEPEDSMENRLYARRHYSTIRQMKSGLPNIPGVFPLSKTEIKKDVREMERNVNEDTDSDSSIMSEDVLVSSYPVKPRKAPKVIIPVKPVSTGPTDIEREYDGKTVDQTLAFLDAVRRNKKDLYSAECERERLEDLNLSYRLSIDDTSKRYRQVKQDEGNYFRVIQGFHTQALRLQMGLNRQNAMFYDVLTALQRRRDAAKSLAEEVLLLKKSAGLNGRDGQSAHVTGEVCNDANTADSPALPFETALLRADLSKSGAQVVLFKGQWIRTPMGDGKILSIQPKDEKVILQLSFGKLYANLRRCVCWGKVSSSMQHIELASDEVLRQRWLALQSSFLMSPEVSRGIRSIVGQSDDEAVTDKDDDNSNDDSSPTDTTAEDQSSSSSGGNAVSLSAQNIDRSAEHDSAAIASLNHAEGGPSVISSFPLKGLLHPSANAGISSNSGGRTLSRQALRTVCATFAAEPILSHQRDASLTLPLVFAPTASLPHLIELSQSGEAPEVRFCQQALSGTPQIGSMASLAWDGDVIEMSRELQTLQDEISRLEIEQNQYIGQIQSVRSRCAQLSTDTSGLRLAIFTRRVRHRNNLNSHVMSNLALQAASSVPAPSYAFPGAADALNGVDSHSTVPVASLRSSRGNSNSIAKDESLLGTSRSSTRLVNSVPPAGPSGSNSPSPEGGISGERVLGYEDRDVAAASNGSRKRGREPLAAVEILTSSRRRPAHSSASAGDVDPDMKEARRSALGSSSSSSGNIEDEEDEEEAKEEVGSQDVDEEEIEVESAQNGSGAGKGGARTAGGFGGKKKPRKQRRI